MCLKRFHFVFKFDNWWLFLELNIYKNWIHKYEWVAEKDHNCECDSNMFSYKFVLLARIACFATHLSSVFIFFFLRHLRNTYHSIYFNRYHGNNIYKYKLSKLSEWNCFKWHLTILIPTISISRLCFLLFVIFCVVYWNDFP